MEQSLTKRQIALNERSKMLALKPTAFSGNSNARKNYLNFLVSIHLELTKWQNQACIGLLLSDATLEQGRTLGTYRLKIQQSYAHKDFIFHIKDLLKEYMGNDQPPTYSNSLNRSNVYEVDTLLCEQLAPLKKFFFAQEIGQGFKKQVLPEIKPFITPVTVAYWFMGDGGKSDYTENKGKGITFHTQGFNLKSCEILKEAFFENFNYVVEIVLDTEKPNPEDNQYRIQIPGRYFDDFICQVGPYIHLIFISQ